jgi:hypothetical protein
MIHHLKTWPEYFKAVQSGKKPFELRKNDRNFQVGDVLMLHEYDPEIGLNDMSIGSALRLEVTYIFEDDGTFGLEKGYCIMGIKFADFAG